MKNIISKLNKTYLTSSQRLGTLVKNPSENAERVFYLFLGVMLINLGVADLALATNQGASKFTIEQGQFIAIICAILDFIEGAFGALIMIIAGIGAIVSAAFGQYKAALGLLAVAIGAFILRSLVNTFFGTNVLSGCQSNNTNSNLGGNGNP